MKGDYKSEKEAKAKDASAAVDDNIGKTLEPPASSNIKVDT